MADDPHRFRGHAHVMKAAGVVGLATLASRILGFIRDMVVAGFFGAGLATDAFFVAFRLPNLLRRLFAEGSLTISFVPVFTEYLEKKSRKDAFELAAIAFSVLSVILAAVSVMGVILAPVLVRLIAPGFVAMEGKYALTVFLTRLMFPYIFFISLVALCMGILNSLRHFAMPALAPVALNISMIAAAVLLRGFFDEPITALAVGVIVGGVAQLIMQFPVLVSKGMRLRPRFNFSHPGIRRISFLMMPAVFGAAVYQVNIFVSTLLASFLPQGSVSYLYYADRLVQLPLGIFAIAIGTASLPSFAGQVTRGELDEFRASISFSLRLIFFVTIPATCALIILRVPIISVLFERGEFDAVSTLKTATALLYYAVGLWAFSAIRVVVSAFYALQDTKTPVRVAVVSLVVNIIMGIILMFPLKHGGLALATSIASAVNIILLTVVLHRRTGAFLDRPFVLSVGKACIASLVMSIVIQVVVVSFEWQGVHSFSLRCGVLAAVIGLGLAVFAGMSYVLRSPELMMIFREIGKKAMPKGDNDR